MPAVLITTDFIHYTIITKMLVLTHDYIYYYIPQCFPLHFTIRAELEFNSTTTTPSPTQFYPVTENYYEIFALKRQRRTGRKA